MSEQTAPQGSPDNTAAAVPRRRLIAAAGIAVIACAGLSLFFRSVIPLDNPLLSVPEILFVVTFLLPVLFWQSAVRKGAAKIATVASAVTWVLGIVLSFAISPKTNLIYYPDALLLAGFLPLLFLWRFSWPWLVFGLLNFGIGVFLQSIVYIPDSFFPKQLAEEKHHLQLYHPSITWWVFGALVLLYGFGRLIKNTLKLARSRLSSKTG